MTPAERSALRERVDTEKRSRVVKAGRPLGDGDEGQRKAWREKKRTQRMRDLQAAFDAQALVLAERTLELERALAWIDEACRYVMVVPAWMSRKPWPFETPVAYLSEEARLEARRETWRASKRKAKSG